MVYPALLPLMRTPRLPVFDCTDAPADLNGLVGFAQRRNLVSARVPSYFKRSLHLLNPVYTLLIIVRISSVFLTHTFLLFEVLNLVYILHDSRILS